MRSGRDFVPRQDPNRPYSAVFRGWVLTLHCCQLAEFFRDRRTSRDFCFVDNAVQLNLLAAMVIAPTNNGVYRLYYVAGADSRTLNELLAMAGGRSCIPAGGREGGGGRGTSARETSGSRWPASDLQCQGSAASLDTGAEPPVAHGGLLRLCGEEGENLFAA